MAMARMLGGGVTLDGRQGRLRIEFGAGALPTMRWVSFFIYLTASLPLVFRGGIWSQL